MNIKRIIREELDGLEWIKNTKSNQDIAQEIADETKIKNGKLYPPFLSSHTSLSSPLFILSPSPLFRNYGEEQYGLNKEDANDVWKRYGKLLKNKVNNLNESNELEWIQGGPDFNLQTSEFYIDLDGVSDKKACEIQQKILDMGVYWSGKGKNLKKEHCNNSKAYIIKKGKLYISTYNYNKYNTMVKQLKDTTENFPRLYGKNFSQLFK